MSWFRAAALRADSPTRSPVTIYERDIRSYASEIGNAQARVAMVQQQLADAHRQLDEATAAFIAHCASLDLPIEMEPTTWPKKPYRLDD